MYAPRTVTTEWLGGTRETSPARGLLVEVEAGEKLKPEKNPSTFNQPSCTGVPFLANKLHAVQHAQSTRTAKRHPSFRLPEPVQELCMYGLWPSLVIASYYKICLALPIRHHRGLSAVSITPSPLFSPTYLRSSKDT